MLLIFVIGIILIVIDYYSSVYLLTETVLILCFYFERFREEAGEAVVVGPSCS